MTPSPRATARRLAHASRLFGLWHGARNRDTLTVVMFHRVCDDPPPAVDPVYTVTTSLFAACLRFLRRHFQVVDLAAVLASRDGGAPLPPRALLITFDDGWRDTLTAAAPVLRDAAMPALVFVATDPLVDPSPLWWQETLLRALRERRADPARIALACGARGADTLSLLLGIGALDDAARDALLAPFARRPGCTAREMLRPDDLATLEAAGVAVASHGASHLPLARVPDPRSDLARADETLAAILGARPRAVSFPHGSYDARVAALAASGARVVFSSDPCLNLAPGGRPGGLLGRVTISPADISDARGELEPSRLASWLFRRARTRLPEPVAA